MTLQNFGWLPLGNELSTLQHALVGIGCLLAYDTLSRWRANRLRTRDEKSNADVPHPGKSLERRAA